MMKYSETSVPLISLLRTTPSRCPKPIVAVVRGYAIGNISVENDPTKISSPIHSLDALLGTFLHLSSSFSTRDEGEGSIGVGGAT